LAVPWSRAFERKCLYIKHLRHHARSSRVGGDNHINGFHKRWMWGLPRSSSLQPHPSVLFWFIRLLRPFSASRWRGGGSRVDFLRHGSDVQRAKRKRPLATIAARDLRRLWRIGGPNIPCQVASPQSLTLFLRAWSAYRAPASCRNYLWTSELCLRKSIRALPAALRYAGSG
jgi:hypothetical protein